MGIKVGWWQMATHGGLVTEGHGEGCMEPGVKVLNPVAGWWRLEYSWK